MSSKIPSGHSAGYFQVNNNRADAADSREIEKPYLPSEDHDEWVRKRSLQCIMISPFSIPKDHLSLQKNKHSDDTQHDRKQKDTKGLVLSEYWDNRAPLCVLGADACILKETFTKKRPEPQVILPPAVEQRLKTLSSRHPLLDQHYWHDCIEHWLSFDGVGRQRTIESSLQLTTIRHSDPRKALHGQSGVVAACDIPAYSVIAPYAGLYCAGNDVAEEMARYGANVGRYAVDCSLGGVQIDLCGYGHGNITICINANTTYSEHEPDLRDNACFVLATYQGWPYVFVVTIKPVKKGAEVLVDYGRYYWKGY
ncbi:SET domain-containing protein-lysine N-methyltransferase [Kistimonas asteriae]|uniref:SET domain-containing protein-lysine N-methyltransferase n=1 Tax=Kistimonas asteriae TaxID=517724 RepID=UPI001BAAAC25|nr:SET domain-containing protein-lysine N-methyltransferase [Kistimonas asteriae]